MLRVPVIQVTFYLVILWINSDGGLCFSFIFFLEGQGEGDRLHGVRNLLSAHPFLVLVNLKNLTNLII